MYCPSCGTNNKEQFKFCQSCGHNLQTQSVNTAPDNVISQSYGRDYSQNYIQGHGQMGVHPGYGTGYMLEYAGFLRRLAALAVDFILLSIVFSILNWLLGSGLANFIFFFAGAAYFILLESSPQQGTIGKKLMRIRVTDINGQQISTTQAAIRYFSKIISAVILYIGFIMAAFTKQKQGLHDIIAKTLVIKGE